jgi:outer membrane protein assembly factor BamB
MPGSRADILAADQSHVYLRDAVFDKQGARLPEGEPHLFTLTDFLDDTWPHRSYWVFGTKPSISTGCSGRDKNLIYGRLIVFNESTIFGFGRKTVHWSNHFQDGPYRVYAVGRDDGTGQWERSVPLEVRAMILADDVLFLAGVRAKPGVGPTGRRESRPAVLMAVSATDGTELAQCPLDGSPVLDGMAAAGRLYVALETGQLVCLEANGTTQ